MREPWKEPIAIIGIGCRLPGGACDPRAFWEFLRSGRDAIGPVPEDRWSLDADYDPDPSVPGKLNVREAGFIDSVRGFDAAHFGISPREAAKMDPNQRIVLEVAHEAIEDAGIPVGDLAGTATGVFVGISTYEYAVLSAARSELRLVDGYTNMGGALSIAANRISYVFDLRGPSLAIDTACSSSLVALHAACEAIHGGECEQALVGGVNVLLTSALSVGFCKASMLSPDCRSRAFDARANGYVRAEGSGILVIQPLSRALEAGHRVYAVVRGTAVNQDGRTHGMAVPSRDAQERVLRSALERAGVAPHEIQYVEAHGTGTPVGDPIEAHALGAVLGAGRAADARCVVGSVKTNVGHLEAAAGAAGLIKLALSLQHGEIPPHLHFEKPNPEIDLPGLGLRIPTKLEAWPVRDGTPRVAGINSFGFGGTNAHAVLTNAPEAASDGCVIGDGRAELLVLSSRSPEALSALATRYAAFLLEEGAPPLAAVCSAAARRRTHFEHRLAVAGATRAEVADHLAAHAAGEQRRTVRAARVPAVGLRRVAFVYPGMGTQWAGMGSELLRTDRVFAATLAECDALLAKLAGTSLLEELRGSKTLAPLIVQPAIFAVQVGLTRLLASWGVRPDVVVGHSVGEVAAFHAAGILDLPDAVRLIHHRNRVQQALAGRGTMLALGLPLQDARAAIAEHVDRVAIAAVNSPTSVTVTGDAESLRAIEARAGARGTFARFLDVEVPYHSPAMDEVRDEFMASIEGIELREPTIPLVSTVLGRAVTRDDLTGDYWWRNMRDPVLFGPSIEHLLREGCDAFLEVGSHPALGTSIRECARAASAEPRVIHTLRRHEPQRALLLACAGELHALGRPLDWAALHGSEPAHVRLPTSPWRHVDHWSESETSRRQRFGIRVHPLLGDRAATACPTWEVEIGRPSTAYLADHRLGGTVMFPAAGYVEMALAAARSTYGDGTLVIDGIDFERAHVLHAARPSRMQLVLDRASGAFLVHSSDGGADGSWDTHARGTVFVAPMAPPAEHEDPDVVVGRCPQVLECAECYPDPEGGYGPKFQGLVRMHYGGDEGVAEITSPIADEQLSGYVIHPVVFDSALQAASLLSTVTTEEGDRAEGVFVPVHFGAVRVYRAVPGRVRAYTRVMKRRKGWFEFDITVFDQEGRVLFEIERVRSRSVVIPRAPAALHEHLLHYAWEPDARGRRALTRGVGAASEAVRTAPESSPGTEPEEIAAHFALRLSDALSRMGANCSKARELRTRAKSLGVVPEGRPLFESVLDALDSHDVSHATDDGSALDAAWGDLLRRRPAYLAELTIARRFAASLAARLGGAHVAVPADDPMVEHLFTDAPTSRPGNLAITAAVRALVPPGESVRVMTIASHAAPVQEYVLPALPPTRCDAVHCDPSSDKTETERPFFGFPFARATGLHAAAVERASVDLVVVPGPLGASTDPDRVADHARAALAPGGVILWMDEGSTPAWQRLLRGAPASPVVARALERAGFADIASHAFAGSADGRTLCVARAPDSASDAPAPVPHGVEHGAWLVFSDGSALATQLCEALRERADAVVEVLTGDSFAAHGAGRYSIRPEIPDDLEAVIESLASERTVLLGVVHLWGLAAPPVSETAADDLDRIADSTCVAAVHLVQCLDAFDVGHALQVAFVTRGVHAVGGHAPSRIAAAPLWGLARVLANEHGRMRFRRIDLAPMPRPEDVSALLFELGCDDDEDEIAYRDGQRHVHRLVRDGPRDLATGRDAEARAAILGFGTTGVLESLAFLPAEIPAPRPGEVVFRVEATALNFKDVAKVLGLLGTASLEGTASGALLGLECAGTIVAVGAGVSGLAPGVRVLGFAPGSFATHVVCAADLVFPVPAHVPLEQVATLTVVFMTAKYAIDELARLREGESILIHAATGGVGLAAIQIARLRGAKVLATAGTPEKRALLRALGVQQVYDSRSLAFADEIRRDNGGAGVDVVLNSLAGQSIARSLSVLAPYGRFVEIGKTAIERNDTLGLRPFQENLAYFAVDLDRIGLERVDLAARLVREVMELLRDGVLRPLPLRVFPPWAVRDAFRHLARARHVGKVVVSMRGAEHEAALPESEFRVAQDATWVVTGGYSGFGLATAEWLAERGARHLALVGRSGAATTEARAGVERLRARGVDVFEGRANVADREQLALLLDRVRAEMPPIRGIVHAAMVLDDAVAVRLDRERIQRVLAPKVRGAWLLHQLTQDDPLEHFVLYSSLASLVGNPGQSNYAAANAFLDALADVRAAQGVPCTTVNWGALADVGVAARSATVQENLRRLGVEPLRPARGLRFLGTLLNRGVRATAVVPPTDWRRWAQSFPAGLAPRYSRLIESLGGDAGAGDTREGSRRDAILATPAEQRAALVLEFLTNTLAGVLGASPGGLDQDVPVLDLGLDSLMAVEMVAHIRSHLGIEVPPMKFMERIGLRGMAAFVLAQLDPDAGGDA